MDRYSQIIVLCEDSQQARFAYHFLIHCGVHARRIRFNKSPLGKGAGEQFVRDHYPEQVRLYRSKCHHLNIGLVVILDADARSVEAHQNELEAALTAASLRRRGADERIGIFVPKRNIETWICYLEGMAVNEIDDYSNSAILEREWTRSVARLAATRGQPLPAEAPPSLHAACAELERVL